MKISEKILMQAVALYEQGVPASDIAKRFPEEAEELSGVFTLIEQLGSEKTVIVPPKAVLERLLQNLPAAAQAEAPGSRLARWQIFTPVAVGAFALLIILILPKTKSPLPTAATFNQEALTTPPQDTASSMIAAAPMAAKSSAPEMPDEFSALENEMNANTPADDASTDSGLATASQNNTTDQFDTAARDSQI